MNFSVDITSRRRSESHDRRRDNSEDRIDKKRLLEIARKNAISMLRNGTLPGTQNMAPEAKEKVLAKMRFGGKMRIQLRGENLSTFDFLRQICRRAHRILQETFQW